jgi:transcription elongation factor GreA
MLKPGSYDIIDDEKWGKKKKSGINVGNTVVLILEKEKITYTIVGSQEANIFENKISNESPIGKALIGKNKDDVVKVVSPSGTKEYTISDVK